MTRMQILIGLSTALLAIGIIWIWIIAHRNRANREAEAYAQSFRDQLSDDAKRIDAAFGVR